ncbi:wd40 repeat-containing protein : WD40 repeat-containing protein OS=Singulisphaera acidiphila (strain ATCC BAA-1392 / DSM 18658 / VKM B-2454 / MOB10) GN=Sinac_3618 PE=4 SV=1: Pkinase: WD40: WD40 [Gemmata massiliana]|uniref:Protein kinase domain-containing protein n=1 Tax=Gemmata massiliana TaxID=1210884 RepID=A0A6P2DFE9_9BACT|nr:serine/threonine-protein kinase [Gemmata massiliana]VTR99487.1 wd40 repeat-containing protein : WD40 repeat-containing protein OS=Singulisphaera acidiphila (strain ATCC BAA-1392 / DSM 18658 / VKM B-2454 / MOB10) GN=Sinac_3618 PE=4 SV=1: Pkinase: WD40: WD40 [Gemmata massiliana]
MPHTEITNDFAFVLYAQWEDARAQGSSTSLEEICANHPELLPDVREIARRLVPESVLSCALPGGESVPARESWVPHDWTKIGQGASSLVFRGQDPTFGTTVAFKVLQVRGAVLAPGDGVRLMKRFEQEARILARLKHDGIVRIFKTFDLGGRPVIEMEHLPNGSLATHLEEVRAQGAVGTARFMERVARAVGFAHERGIVHRDLKPSNILLDDAGRPCVSDFGVAKLIHPDAPDGPAGKPGTEPVSAPGTDSSSDTDPEITCLTTLGRQPGTKAYMAPEQFNATFGEIKPETDVWALGVVLYELVTGTRPFTGGNSREWAEAICTGPLPRSRLLPRQRADRLKAIALRCLAREQKNRYPSATAVADALAAVARPVWRKLALATGLLVLTSACVVALTRPEPGTVAVPVHVESPAFEREAREAFQFCADGKVVRGLSAFVSLLPRVPEDRHELRTAIRANIAAWSRACAQVDGLYAHSEPISVVAASNDGRWIAIGDERGGVVLWDATTGRTHVRLGEHSRRVTAAAFSQDGRYFATGSYDGSVRVWPVDGFATAAPKSIPVIAWVFAVAFTPDGKHVVTGTQWDKVDGVRFWDTRTGAESKSAPSLNKFPRFPRAFATAPDGREFVALNKDGSAEVWDLESRRVRGELALGSQSAVRSVTYAPDGKTIATGGESLQFWDAKTGQLKSDEHRGDVAVLGFAANGESVAVQVSGELRAWQPAANCFDPLPVLRPTAPDVQVVSGTHLIGIEAARTVVRFRWPDAGVRSLPIPRTRIATSIQADWDRNCVAVVTNSDGLIKPRPERGGGIDLWDAPSGHRVGRPIWVPGQTIMGMGLGPNRGGLAFQSGSATPERPVPVSVVDTGHDRIDAQLPGHRGVVSCIHYLHTWSTWVTAGEDKCLRIWSPAGELRNTILLPAAATRAHVGPGDRLLAVGCVGGRVVCMGQMPEPTLRWVSEPGPPCDQVTISPDGASVVALGQGGGLRAWAVADGSSIPVLTGTTGVRSIAPDGRGPGWVTCHNDGTVRRWADLSAGAPDWEWLPSDGAPVIATDPTGTALVTATSDGKVQAWSIAARLPLGPPVRHYRQVFAGIWGADRVITLSEKSARIWSPTDVRELPKEADLARWLTAITGVAPNSPRDRK